MSDTPTPKTSNISQFLKLSRSGSTKVMVASSSVEKIAALPNNIPILQCVFPYDNARLAYRQELSGQKVPCSIVALTFDYSYYKSRTRETRGEPIEGVSILIMGYDVAVDGQGKPVTNAVPNPAYAEAYEVHAETYKELTGQELDAAIVAALAQDGIEEFFLVPETINTDASGKPIAPKLLMTFAPQWGRDMSRRNYSQAKDLDYLNLVPKGGVPRKNTLVIPSGTPAASEDEAEGPVTTESARRRTESIDWQQIYGLQPQMEKPILNFKIEKTLAEAAVEAAKAFLADPEAALAQYIGTEAEGEPPSYTPEDLAALEENLEFWSNMEIIVEHIPLATNAPSLKKDDDKDTAFASPIGAAATALPSDVFASDPTSA
jgi:hypothetical protein